MVKTLSIDIETYSDVDLIKCGVYAYTDSPAFEILLFAYSVDGGPVEVVDLAQGEQLPTEILSALTDPAVQKIAYNANFERTCIARHYGISQPPEQWKCTAVDASRLGLPGFLDGVAQALKLDVQKDSAGKALIKYFSVPCKPTQVNGGRTRNLPEHDPEKWQQYIEYNRRDVEVEMEIRKKIDPALDVSPEEQALWSLDQRINDRGVRVDLQLMEQAIACNEKVASALKQQSKQITGLQNPNSTAQLSGWLEEQGHPLPNLQADTVDDLLATLPDGDVKQVLTNRRQLSKASVSKYKAMQRSVCSDGRIKGLLQFYGAGRTGRWAGRIVQVQNLTKNYMKDIENASRVVKSGQFDAIPLLFDESPNDILSQLVRTALVASPGNRLIVSDFSAIEARVIAWFAGEQWRLNVFETHGKIYEASASAMFNVPIENIGKGSDLRQRGKVAELALGYAGGTGALKAMGALDMGLEEGELQGLVDAWRGANPNIVRFWHACNSAAIEAVEGRTAVSTHKLTFDYRKGILYIVLPSGRRLAYVRPRIEEGRFGQPALVFDGLDFNRKWGKVETFGGKLVENIVQATARDCLAVSMMNVEAAGYEIVMHVHDELVTDTPYGFGSLAEVEEIMAQPISWAPGLPLNADGFETEFYMKEKD
ncbi:DNA polymerase [Sporosarcina trichiuri]|uniref:DNA polymerase n=1 Tax=Sporosarcina trichiuri TaxID=3056445 RepID=UPI0025B2A7AA|nr:DNA polymerase [Sporosarcina sp. 0.2-SM1T-5]WJY27426.1 DNA polymerase [Sporosarcina sp. 0.2-SM1T-5]WJY27446.1 DNA polymerase [Sporosarcina sp. 0.2-SM1T-5]